MSVFSNMKRGDKIILGGIEVIFMYEEILPEKNKPSNDVKHTCIVKVPICESYVVARIDETMIKN